MLKQISYVGFWSSQATRRFANYVYIVKLPTIIIKVIMTACCGDEKSTDKNCKNVYNNFQYWTKIIKLRLDFNSNA